MSRRAAHAGEPSRLVWRRETAVAIGWAGLPAAAAVSAWLVGDLSTAPADEAYYLFEPQLSEAVHLAAGLLGLMVLVAVVAVVTMARTHPRLRRTAVLLAVTGALAGAAYRVATAGVVGANIGGGLVLLVGGPALVVVLVVAVVWTVEALVPPRRA